MGPQQGAETQKKMAEKSTKKKVKPSKEHVEAVLRLLDQEYGTDDIIYLEHGSAWQLLIAVILSAQCTDARVNMVTPALFRQFPDVESFAEADLGALEDAIHSTGFYHAKAKNIKACCRRLHDVYNDQVPDTMEELLTLPGVGRKTANLVLGDIYHQPAVVTDTHCIRIAGRLGLTKSKEPVKVEQDLRAILPPEKSSDFCHRMVLHGRKYCMARKPDCKNCPLTGICKKIM